jgi:hypothetical protein
VFRLKLRRASRGRIEPFLCINLLRMFLRNWFFVCVGEQEEEEEVNERPKYAWEDGSLTDSGMIINKQGKMQSAAKKLTPQQKKAEKVTPDPAP